MALFPSRSLHAALLGLTWALLPGSLAAQPAAPAAPSADAGEDVAPERVKKARELWYRGVDAFRNGDYEKARQAFTECYQLMPKSDVLRNLSISEIHSGHFVSAARHLRQLLEAPGELPAEVREEAETRLAQAEAQVGQLAISVDVGGSEILVDGDGVGRAPLEGSWYVEPGQHEVVVRHDGYPVEQRQVFALAGISIPVNVELESLRRERLNDTRAASLMGTAEGQTPASGSGADAGIGTGAAITLATTSTLAAVGLAGGIYFTIAANQHDSDADGMRVHLGGPNACNPSTRLELDCRRLHREQNDGRNDRQRAAISFIGLGVASAATIGYALWLALDDEKTPEASAGAIVPGFGVGPGSASFSLTTRF